MNFQGHELDISVSIYLLDDLHTFSCACQRAY